MRVYIYSRKETCKSKDVNVIKQSPPDSCLRGVHCGVCLMGCRRWNSIVTFSFDNFQQVFLGNFCSGLFAETPLLKRKGKHVLLQGDTPRATRGSYLGQTILGDILEVVTSIHIPTHFLPPSLVCDPLHLEIVEVQGGERNSGLA